MLMRSLSIPFAVLLLLARHESSSSASAASTGRILVVGSANADTFLPVKRLPVEGENLTVPPGRTVEIDVPGGKGCNQAIAAAKLLRQGAGSVAFLGQFGNDAAATILRSALTDADVDVTACGTCHDAPSGRGYVFLQEHSGKVSAVVLGGSNVEGWKGWDNEQELSEASAITDQYLDALLDGKSCVLLQREVPEYVNYRIAKRAREVGVVVMQDVGGEDRPMDEAMMSLCDYILPNKSELNRLCQSLGREGGVVEGDDGQEANINEVVERAKLLQEHGANNVLVTLGERGSVLVTKDADKSEVIIQESCRLPSHLSVVDETGAGDCFRAAFAVAFAAERRSIREAMQIASAAGALAVTRKGAVPSIPERQHVDALRRSSFGSPPLSIPRGGDERSSDQGHGDDECPHLFGSRLNSMKDRSDLHDGELNDVRHWVQRQGKIRGLGCIDYNWPQHFHTWTNAEAKAALDEVGLVAGAVCLRYPSKFARGAMNHPDANLRREAIDLTKEAAQTAKDLGCNEVVVWSAYDGYDYPFQVNYHDKWKQLVDAFQEICDAYPDIKFSLEFKPSDENTRGYLLMCLRSVLYMCVIFLCFLLSLFNTDLCLIITQCEPGFFTVPSTGAALLLVKEIDRPNMGLTLDMGHILMAGENPGQSIAMVGEKLFGIQLNDGYTRLAAEDGMMFGSVHPSMALEAIYQLQQIKGGFQGHLYFDTFPQRTDPVKEAEFNIQRVKDFWRAAKRMDRRSLLQIMDEHDAIGALNLIDDVLRR